MLCRAARIAGKAKTSPISAPPINSPIPRGRFMFARVHPPAASGATSGGIQPEANAVGVMT